MKFIRGLVYVVFALTGCSCVINIPRAISAGNAGSALGLVLLLVLCVGIILFTYTRGRRPTASHQEIYPPGTTKELAEELLSSITVTDIADDENTERIVSDCWDIILGTRSISTFNSRYVLLIESLADYKDAIAQYPALLMSCVERAVQDALTLKTPKGRAARLGKLLDELYKSPVFNDECGHTQTKIIDGLNQLITRQQGGVT